MTNRRLSAKIDITIDPDQLNKIDSEAVRLGSTRSGIIREALWDRLDKQKPRIPIRKYTINGQPYEHNRLFKDYLTEGMSPQESIKALDDFEAAQRNYRQL